MAVEPKHQFIQAIQQNERLIYKVATFYTNTKDDRDDLVQEIVYNLWRSFPSFKQHSSLSTWMYRVAMNVSVFHLKKNKKVPKAIPIDGDALNLGETNVDEFTERWQSLEKHLQQLNLFDKGIVLLYLEEKSHEEIGEIMGISKTNVGTRLSRIKEKLRQQVSKNS